MTPRYQLRSRSIHTRYYASLRRLWDVETFLLCCPKGRFVYWTRAGGGVGGTQWSYLANIMRTPLARLPIRERVKFKVACLVRQSLSGQAPLYLADDCRLMSDSTRRSLRSADVSTCVVPPTLSSYCDRTFAAAGPRLWTLFQSSFVIRTSPTDCSDDSWREAFFGKHEPGALWLRTCGAIEKHLLTYLRLRRCLQSSWAEVQHGLIW